MAVFLELAAALAMSSIFAVLGRLRGWNPIFVFALEIPPMIFLGVLAVAIIGLVTVGPV